MNPMSKTFIVQKKINGKARRITIGPCDAINIKDARELAREKITEIVKGIDHSAEKSAARNCQFP